MMTFEQELLELLHELVSTLDAAPDDTAAYIDEFPNASELPAESAIIVGWIRGAASARELTVSELLDTLDADQLARALTPAGAA